MNKFDKKVVISACVALILILGFVGFNIYQMLVYKVEPTVVSVEKMTLQDIENSEIYQGTLISRQSVNIQPQVSGVISSITVKAGDKVQKGQLLVVIDPKKQEAALNSIKSQKSTLITDLETAKIQYNRHSELYERGAVSKHEMENYKAAYEKAKSALDTNNAQIKEQTEQLKYHKIVAPIFRNCG